MKVKVSKKRQRSGSFQSEQGECDDARQRLEAFRKQMFELPSEAPAVTAPEMPRVQWKQSSLKKSKKRRVQEETEDVPIVTFTKKKDKKPKKEKKVKTEPVKKTGPAVVKAPGGLPTFKKKEQSGGELQKKNHYLQNHKNDVKRGVLNGVAKVQKKTQAEVPLVEKHEDVDALEEALNVIPRLMDQGISRVQNVKHRKQKKSAKPVVLNAVVKMQKTTQAKACLAEKHEEVDALEEVLVNVMTLDNHDKHTLPVQNICHQKQTKGVKPAVLKAEIKTQKKPQPEAHLAKKHEEVDALVSAVTSGKHEKDPAQKTKHQKRKKTQAEAPQLDFVDKVGEEAGPTEQALVSVHKEIAEYKSTTSPWKKQKSTKNSSATGSEKIESSCTKNIVSPQTAPNPTANSQVTAHTARNQKKKAKRKRRAANKTTLLAEVGISTAATYSEEAVDISKSVASVIPKPKGLTSDNPEEDSSGAQILKHKNNVQQSVAKVEEILVQKKTEAETLSTEKMEEDVDPVKEALFNKELVEQQVAAPPQQQKAKDSAFPRNPVANADDSESESEVSDVENTSGDESSLFSRLIDSAARERWELLEVGRLVRLFAMQWGLQPGKTACFLRETCPELVSVEFLEGLSVNLSAKQLIQIFEEGSGTSGVLINKMASAVENGHLSVQDPSFVSSLERRVALLETNGEVMEFLHPLLESLSTVRDVGCLLKQLCEHWQLERSVALVQQILLSNVFDDLDGNQDEILIDLPHLKGRLDFPSRLHQDDVDENGNLKGFLANEDSEFEEEEGNGSDEEELDESDSEDGEDPYEGETDSEEELEINNRPRARRNQFIEDEADVGEEDEEEELDEELESDDESSDSD